MAPGASPCLTAASASTAHSVSSATVTMRNRRTRNGWTKRIGTNVKTANRATVAAAIHGVGRNRRDRTRRDSTPPENRGNNCPSVFISRSAK